MKIKTIYIQQDDRLIKYNYKGYIINNSIFDNCKEKFHIEDTQGNVLEKNISEEECKKIIDNKIGDN